MIQPRVIPCLLLSGNRLVKTKHFKNPAYIGDPVNAVRIFSEKEADEIIFLDISASKDQSEPNYKLVEEMASEAFMPVCYGGGVRSISAIRLLIRLGVEKVLINTAALDSYSLIRDAVNIFGSQAIVGCVDVRRNIFGRYKIFSKTVRIPPYLNLDDHISHLVAAGIGELVINDVRRDGTMTGFDHSLIRTVSQQPVPVVVCGGAGSLLHLKDAVMTGGASAVAAGSLFVFKGVHRAVLISYPDQRTLKNLFAS